jgi:hypothetical protein
VANNKLKAVGLIESLLSGSRNIITEDYTNTTPPYQVTQVALANGDNTIAVPANAKGVLILFAPASTTWKQLKGDAADVGIQCQPTGWMFITLNQESEDPNGGPGFTGTTSLIIASYGDDSANLTELVWF